jgi:hypothetical protein
MDVNSRTAWLWNGDEGSYSGGTVESIHELQDFACGN